LGLMQQSSESEELARRVPDSAGVYVVPAFVGLGAPYWDAYARGTIQGLTRASNKYHIIRAAIESMAYQTADVLQIMKEETGVELSSLRVDGGAAANNLLLQFQSDILGQTLHRPYCVETTAWGAAGLAGLGVGVYSNLDEFRRVWRIDRAFAPSIGAAEREVLIAGWHRAVERSLSK